MKRILGILAVLLSLTNCGKAITGDKVKVCFQASEDSPVKGAVANGGNNVSRLDLLVFRSSDGLIDTYASSNGNTLTASVTAGCSMHWFMIANAPAGVLDEITREADFLATCTLLSQTTASTLVMHGGGVKTFSAGEPPVSVIMSRYVSKVSIGNIAVNWLGDFATPPQCILETVALVNARGDIPMSGIQSADGLWYNCSSIDDALGGIVASCLVSRPGRTIIGTEAVEIGTELYAMPNSSTYSDNASVTPWGPRRTRIVIGLRIDGDLQWYPIDLPAMQCNTHYRVENVYITGPGTANPDSGTDRANLSFDVELHPWGSETCNVDFGT